MISFLLSFGAGALTTLSPCVLPVLPIIVGSALREHKLAPLTMAAGLIASFVSVGWTIAAFGNLLGMDSNSIRMASAIMLGVFGAILLSGSLQGRMSSWLAPLAGGAEKLLQNPKLNGLGGQFIVGLLLGALWSPCSGPTLGTAITLAAQEGGRLRSGLLLCSFGVGAALPMLLISYGAQGLFKKHRDQVFRAAGAGKVIFGVLMLLVSVLIVSGFDRSLEGWIVERLPDSIIDLTTRF